MRRRIAFALTAVLTAVFLCPPTAGATARSDAWRALAVDAFLDARALDAGTDMAHTYAYMAATSGRLNGWGHSYTATYLSRVYARANPDGGYGLGYAYDAFSDGSVNPATTTYTVTLADHVGRPLLEGLRAGAVPRAKVQTVVDLLMSTPRVPVPRGQCVAYSRAAADAAAGCVHNVNAAVGAFLAEAQAAGISATGMHQLIADITVAEVNAYDVGAVWWPYVDAGDLQDADHNSASAEAMYRLAYWVGRESVYQHMTGAYADNALAPIAHMRLTGLPGGTGSWSRTVSGLTLWCEMGDRWLAEATAFVANPPSVALRRLAQAAYYTSRAWQACD